MAPQAINVHQAPPPALKVVIDLDLLETLMELAAYRIDNIGWDYDDLYELDRSVLTEEQYTKLQELYLTLQES